MKIDHHISSLLYDHDCVIVTDFGGFVASYKPSQLNSTQHTFLPPSKRIAFNENLRNNDGLLANHISKSENILYAEACEIIIKYVSECFNKLQKGGKLDIEKIGVLFYDDEKNIQFIPDANVNFLKDSFGLSLIHSPSIKRKDEVLTSDVLEFPGKKKKAKTDWRIVELIPAAAIAALIFTFPILTKQFHSELGNLNPFAYKNTIENTTTAIKQRPSADYIIAQALKRNNSFDTGHSLNATLVSTDSVKNETPAVAININPPDEKIPASIKSDADLNYHIIAGCFRVEENAGKLQSELKAKGFDAVILGKTNRGLTMVSASSFSNLSEAKTILLKIQQEVNTEAWIFRKN